MTRAEKITREYIRRLGRIPRKRKKVVKAAIKRYIQAQIDCGNWDLIEYHQSVFIGGTKKEYESYGDVDLINKH